MRYLQGSSTRLEVIVDPAGEHGGFHRRRPRLRQRFHPAVQVPTCGGNRSFGVDLATAILHAVADLPLVNIQADVIHRFHGGASFGVSESACSLSSAFLHQALLPRPIHSNLSGLASIIPGVVTLQSRSLVCDSPSITASCDAYFRGATINSTRHSGCCG